MKITCFCLQHIHSGVNPHHQALSLRLHVSSRCLLFHPEFGSVLFLLSFLHLSNVRNVINMPPHSQWILQRISCCVPTSTPSDILHAVCECTCVCVCVCVRASLHGYAQMPYHCQHQPLKCVFHDLNASSFTCAFAST